MTEQKLYTCQRCRNKKPATDFYERHDKPKPRPASYCKACNHEAVIEAKYRKEARRDPKAFAAKIARSEELINKMLRALQGVTA